MRWMFHSRRRLSMKSATSSAMSGSPSGYIGVLRSSRNDLAREDREVEQQAAVAGAVVEPAVRPDVTGNRLEEVVRAPRFLRLVGLLVGEAVAREGAGGEARGDLFGGERLDRRPADDQLAAPVVRGVVDGVGGDLRLEDRR